MKGATLPHTRRKDGEITVENSNLKTTGFVALGALVAVGWVALTLGAAFAG